MCYALSGVGRSRFSLVGGAASEQTGCLTRCNTLRRYRADASVRRACRALDSADMRSSAISMPASARCITSVCGVRWRPESSSRIVPRRRAAPSHSFRIFSLFAGPRLGFGALSVVPRRSRGQPAHFLSGTRTLMAASERKQMTGPGRLVFRGMRLDEPFEWEAGETWRLSTQR